MIRTTPLTAPYSAGRDDRAAACAAAWTKNREAVNARLGELVAVVTWLDEQREASPRDWSVIGSMGHLAFELDEDVNEIGGRLDTVLSEPGFDTFTSNVLTLAGAAANPAAEVGVAVAKFVFGVVTENMMRDRDDQIGILYQSFNRFEHYPHGERKRDDVPDLSNNMLIDYSIFGTEY